jgi:hypothetical protein
MVWAPFTTIRARSPGRYRLVDLPSGSNGDAVLKRALSKVKPDEGGDAHFRFGKASRFSLTDPTSIQKTNPSIHYSFPPDDNQPDEPTDVHVSEYDEYSRCWQLNRVENPDDPDQWVEVKNIFRLVLVGRDHGNFIALNLRKASEVEP